MNLFHIFICFLIYASNASLFKGVIATNCVYKKCLVDNLCIEKIICDDYPIVCTYCTTDKPTSYPTSGNSPTTLRPTTKTPTGTDSPVTVMYKNDMYVIVGYYKIKYRDCIRCENCVCDNNELIVHLLDTDYLCSAAGL